MGVADNIPALVPHGLQGLIATFGDPKVFWNQDKGEWDVDSAWEHEYMMLLEHPFIPNTRRELFVNRVFAPLLSQLLDRWSARVAAGDPYRLRKLACFSPRLQRGAAPDSKLYSVHSWGAAVDANDDTNPIVLHCPINDPRRKHISQGGERDIPDAWLDDARQIGLFCGIDFLTRSDPQHIQACTGY